MIKLVVLSLLCISQAAFSQITFNVNNFSPDYYGKITVEDTSDVFMKGSVAIYNKKSGKQLIKVKSNELAFDHPEGKVQANIKELPYGEQSVIMYDDFNFDGIKDFAIMDGQESCYHGPSFTIFLGGEVGFLRSKEFTKLAHDYCGMFDIDTVRKTIHTMTKSGCCWHEFSEFIVESNKPKAVKVVEEDAQNLPYVILTEKTWDGKKMVKSVTKNLDTADLTIFLSFKVIKNGKHVLLFAHNQQLNYALLDTNQNVEFSYPIETDEETPGFMFDTTKNNLSVTFQNKSANYHIYEGLNKVGVEAITKGVLYAQDGDIRSKKGSLKDLLKMKLENLVIR